MLNLSVGSTCAFDDSIVIIVIIIINTNLIGTTYIRASTL